MSVVHIIGAGAALLLGALVIVMPKGTTRHRVVGAGYVVSLLVVNVAALTIPRGAPGLGPFHVLAIISLATLTAGLAPMWVMRRTPSVLAFHAITMCFSYVGLVAAGLSQVAAELTPGSAALAVTGTSFVTFAVGAMLIFTRVPRILSQPRPRSRST